MRVAFLVFCLVFTSSASAYLHIGEHHHSDEAGLLHYHSPSQHQHEHAPNQQDTEHEHHFHLHMIGDVVDYRAELVDENVQATAPELSQRLALLSYAPPIPPPNA